MIDASTETNSGHLSGWERAEVLRSAQEAGHVPDRWLRLIERDLNRYASPPADTSYPLEYAYSLLGDLQGRVVLDFGCGSGENTPHLCLRRAKVVSFDISEELVRVARRRLCINNMPNGARFLVASAHSVPFQSASVDVIFAIAILHHLDLATVAAEIGRVLKPGGQAIFQEPVRNSMFLRWMRSIVPIRDPNTSPFERPLREGQLRDFGQAAGLSLKRSRVFVLPHVQIAEILRIASKRLDLCYQIDRMLLRHVPFLERYAAVQVMEWKKEQSDIFPVL
jgi:SAM-dependent methyltransferase